MRLVHAPLAALFWAASPAAAQTPDASDDPAALRLDPVLDGVVTATAVVTLALAETVLKAPFAVEVCRWCEPPGLDASIRSALRWNDPRAADLAGTGTGFVLSPVASYSLLALAGAHDDRGGEFWENTLVVTEAVALTLLLTDVVKWTVGRQRPLVHYAGEGWEDLPRAERNLSFFSGHSALTFAFAAASGTVASMRGYRWAPLVWSAGGAIAAFTAYSRIAADAHYFTDVVTGSLVGVAAGILLPYVFHRPD